MGRGGTSAREISFVSLMACGPKVSHSALAMGVTVSETRQGGSQYDLTSWPVILKYLSSGSLGHSLLIPCLNPNDHDGFSPASEGKNTHKWNSIKRCLIRVENSNKPITRKAIESVI